MKIQKIQKWGVASRVSFFLALLGLSTLVSVSGMRAQSIISGEITGTVTDATQAVVPNAAVALMSTETGFNATATTSASGTFRFPLLRPGNYNLSVTAKGFRVSKTTAVAAVGAVTEVAVKLEVGATTETVEVVATAPVLETENANLATIYTPSQIENTPSPGGDMTNYALTAPGIVLSTGAGYGNFTANGLGGTSNLYTINGGDMNDPYNNLNNSGSSNNMLGANEVQEVAIVTNGYTGQYGRAASVNMNFTTKSGSNSFHGNAKWDWNGRYLNANDWFNNATATARPFANSNQWGGSIGGPILKNKLFFYYDNEGLRYVLPSGGPVYIPTTAWATAVQANIDAAQPAESAFYKSMFTLYAGAPGGNAATPLGVGDSTTPQGGCGDFAGATLGGTLFGTAGGQACTKTFHTGVVNLNKERLQSLRVDYEVSAKDRLNGRWWQDRGTQPTYTDPINSAFNELSVQPQDAGQFTETHTFNSNLVNQLIIGGFDYSAIFGNTAGASVFPTTIGVAFGGNSCGLLDGNLSCIGGELYRFPQGRNVTQYQLVDDLSWTKGNHGFKFGVNFLRIDYADYGPAANHTGDLRVSSITDFTNGVLSSSGGSVLRQQFSTGRDFQINNYSVGFYAQDEWRATSTLNLTLALRLDRNSNETCTSKCFTRFNGDFLTGISHDPNTPYNQSVSTGLSTIFPSIQRIVWEPRAGFAWTPAGRNTVIRGGAGIFSDLYPAQVSTNNLSNPPHTAIWTITATQGTNDNIPIAPGVAGGAFSQAAANNAAFTTAFPAGGTIGSIQVAVPSFKGPNFYTSASHILNPRYAEWNLEVEHSFGSKLAVSLNYVGNHGTDELILINGANAYYRPTTKVAQPACTPQPTCTQPAPFIVPSLPFGNLPAAPIDPRFGVVDPITNGGISNYNGLTASVMTKSIKGLTATLSYTYSHSLDYISNGGIDQYSTNQTGDSLRFQVNPNNLRQNYGSSDYDFRHVVNLNYVWEVPYLKSNRWLGGWTIAGVLIRRSGEPYSVVNTAIPGGALKNYSTTGAVVMSDFLGGAKPTCTVSSDQVNSPFACLSASQFPATSCTATTMAAATACVASFQHDFGNTGRNQFRGPGYFDTDLTIKKSFRITKKEEGRVLTLGANAYNVLNHPNFGNPDSSLTSGTFGTIQNTVTPASSPYGNFQGSAVSGRILQLEMGVKF